MHSKLSSTRGCYRQNPVTKTDQTQNFGLTQSLLTVSPRSAVKHCENEVHWQRVDYLASEARTIRAVAAKVSYKCRVMAVSHLLWRRGFGMDQFQQNSLLRSETANLGNIADVDSIELAQQKIEARLRLLAMPPEEAQVIVEQTLYPQLWECRVEDHEWEESLRTYYGEYESLHPAVSNPLF